MFELSGGFRSSTRVPGNVDPAVFAFVKLWEIRFRSEVKFPNKSGGITGFTENIPDVHVVAFQCDIETGIPLILISADRFGVKLAMGASGKPTRQKAVARWSTDRATDVGAGELHSLLCHAVEVRSVRLAAEGRDA